MFMMYSFPCKVPCFILLLLYWEVTDPVALSHLDVTVRMEFEFAQEIVDNAREPDSVYHCTTGRLAMATSSPIERVYEFVVGKQGKKEYPHLDKKNPSTREETHEWKRMSRYEGN